MNRIMSWFTSSMDEESPQVQVVVVFPAGVAAGDGSVRVVVVFPAGRPCWSQRQTPTTGHHPRSGGPLWTSSAGAGRHGNHISLLFLKYYLFEVHSITFL